MTDIPHLDRKGLRQFGLVTGAIIAGLFGAALPWLFGFDYPVWPWVIGAVLGLWGLVAPESMGGFYPLWMQFALLLNKITTPVIMGVLFLLVFTPVALVMRITGRDTMARRFDPDAASYRIVSRRPPKESMERPY